MRRQFMQQICLQKSRTAGHDPACQYSGDDSSNVYVTGFPV